MNPKKILIVDGNAVCYSAYYTSGRLLYKGHGTGIIYGFFNQIQQVCRSQQIAHLVFCWDSRQSRRKLLYPSYKSNRVKSDPNLLKCLEQFARLRKEILPRLGFTNNFHEVGFEADDLIASLCKTFIPQDDENYVIMSNDQDLYQLLTPHVSMYKPNKKHLYTEENFIAEFEIDPPLWAEVKMLAGCHTDSVSGIPGIGEKKAIVYLKQFKGRRPHPVIDTPQAKRIHRENRPLVCLPFAGTPTYTLDWSDSPSFAEWLVLCEELGFHSFLKQGDIWESIFSGIPPKRDLLNKVHISRRKGNNAAAR